MGLAGESISDDRVWIVKTHYPERSGTTQFEANKAIVLVRNPLDAMASLFNMIGTGTHTESLPADEMQVAIQTGLWRVFVEQENFIWSSFLKFWVKTASQVPTYFVRFEDLLERP